MQRKGKSVLGTVEVPFDTLVAYRGILVETVNNIEAFVKKQLNPLLGTEKLMNEISADEKEAQEDPDAIYDEDEDGFRCNYEGCSEDLIYETDEIVEHLKDEHGVKPDDQIIEGWTDEHEEVWKKALKKRAKKRVKKSKKPVKTLPLRWDYSEDGLNDMTMGELWSIAGKLRVPKKGKKPVLIKNILKSQKERGKEKPSPLRDASRHKRIPLTVLQTLAPPSFYKTMRRVSECPKNCPNLAEQNKCTPETCIYVGRNRPTFKEIYCLAKNSDRTQ